MAPDNGGEANRGDNGVIGAEDGTVVEDGTQTELIAIEREFFSGPLPDPELLAQYDAIVPGAADRLVKMAEDSLESQCRIAEESLKTEGQLAKRGQIFGATLLLAMISAVVFLAYIGQAGLAAALFGTAFIGAVVSLYAVPYLGKRLDKD